MSTSNHKRTGPHWPPRIAVDEETYETSIDAMPSLRPSPYFRYKMPVDGLYLCSSYAHPGAGVHGMCGFNAAQMVLAGEKALPSSATRALPPGDQ